LPVGGATPELLADPAVHPLTRICGVLADLERWHAGQKSFFFERLPQGEYTFKYRLRATMAGSFKVAPATLQPMYAPEFAAYSAGHLLTVAPASTTDAAR